ncbi:MAG: hypothetical protein GHHEDOFH_01415 [Pseudorhodoplanes sp.]|nr:hypothetical protein [Pseudorhodoplanes sp.]
MSISSVPPSATRTGALLTRIHSPWVQWPLVAALHLAGLGWLFLTEVGPFHIVLGASAWALLNLFWLALLRRPVVSALLSLLVMAGVILVSQFKFGVTWMTATFLDVLIIDWDTVGFLFKTFPGLRMTALTAAVLAIPLLVMLWRLDPFRVRRRVASAGAAGCFAVLGGLSLSVPEQPWEPFQGNNHVSSFVRSGVLSASQLTTLGWIEADAGTGESLRKTADTACRAVGQRPNIIFILDESSFDVSRVPDMKVPAGYDRHFRSVDGKLRLLSVEGTGGPTWYTEYNVLTGLSARSFGKLSFYVTRIAAGRVERGLPQTLRRCGYKTFSLYPAPGSFLSARAFQHSAGVQRMIDSGEMRAGDVEPDHFYYDQALKVLERGDRKTPHFLFVYTVANHFPWDQPYRADLTPDWRAPGNGVEFDEYIRRQMMSAQDYRDFVAKLKSRFPGEPFLIVRFGDHQPYISSKVIEPDRSFEEVSQNIMQRDPRYFTTYYAIDGVNYRPADLSSAMEMLDAAYLPLVALEAAGLPLDGSFLEQKKILQRCEGMFYDCRDGAEARRFNRLLIDAGLLKGF